jgi:beta-lactam-binding protein with PASTA domain
VAAAVSAVKAAGLVPKVIGINSTKAWVFSQSPSAGSSVPRGSTVNLRTKVGPIP